MHPTLAAHRPLPSAATPAPRPDLYAPIHKALRHAMSDTLVQLGSLDVADRGETARTLDQVEALPAMCDGHLQIDNRFVHPFIEARTPAGTARIADEHGRHLEQFADPSLELAELRRARPAPARHEGRHAGRDLRRADRLRPPAPRHAGLAQAGLRDRRAAAA